MFDSTSKQLSAALCIGFTFLTAVILNSCNSSSSGSSSTTVQGTSNPAPGGNNVGQLTLSVYDSTGALIYSQANASTTLALTSGSTYNFQLVGTNIPTGTSFTMAATNIDVINGTATSTSLNIGDNSYVPPAPGDFLFAISANGSAAATIPSQSYQANVACANPTLTVNSLTASGIAVTAGTGTNLYNYSASAVIAGANGTAPYLCAWDLDGDGIQDTAFTSCDTAVANDYANYVGTRTIGLIVKDACNTSVTVSNSASLAFTVPTMPGNVFIYGLNSAATGTAISDSRIDGVNYLATNSGGHNIVQPLYTPGANGKGSFNIVSTLNYGILSSVNFGMQLNVGNISDTLNISTMTGTVDVSAATLNKLSYSTDEEGDQTPARSLGGTSCTLTDPSAKVTFLQGTPCSAGTTGDQNSGDVEVWGDYVCTVNDSAGSTTITGSFDGVSHIADSCIGGGGGGGGGITPVQL
jgi:hypothetical protein